MSAFGVEIGHAIEADGSSRRLLDLSDDLVREQIRLAGAVLFTGFVDAPGDFAEFADRFSSANLGSLHAGQNRDVVSADGTTSTVNLGTQMVGLHAEMGYSPLRPDLLWFCCVRPAAEHGETTICDGVQLWRSLGASTRGIFEEQPIRYTFRRAGPDYWPLFVGASLSIDETLSRARSEPSLTLGRNDDGTLDISYVTLAVRPTRYTNEPAFVNSLMVQDPATVSFEVGEPLPREIRAEIVRAAGALTNVIPWRSGDIVVIDNSRHLHGRLPFRDTARRILVRMSHANF